MSGKRQNYVYGSVARKLEPEIQEPRRAPQNKLIAKVNNKNKIKILFNIAICCVLALVMMYRYCLLTEMNYGIGKKYNEYEKLRNKNVELKVEIEKGQNLLKIKEIAHNKLNMRVAQKEQVVYVRVPANDFVRYADSSEKKGILNIALRKLEELKNYF